MKIAILGTRGIPNYYGGFEQFAEILSQWLVKHGHSVDVYNPDDHPFQRSDLNDVKIIRVYSNEPVWGVLNTFIFDFLCMLKVRKGNYDILFQLGYHPAALYYWLNMGKKAKIVTNMAGMEWWRSKWRGYARRLIRYCEKRAVFASDVIVSDNVGIQLYYKDKYEVDSPMIAYGADLFFNPDLTVLEEYGLEENGYLMMVARFQPDNNFELILDGYCQAKPKDPIIVIGNYRNSFGQYLLDRYKHTSSIRFVGELYDYKKLSSLRWYCKKYLHGHSCGGTNPSLLEAMASNAYIAAFDNVFNKSVLQDGGEYFSSTIDVASFIDQNVPDNIAEILEKNRSRIQNEYSWDKIAQQYLDLFQKLVNA